MRSKSNNYIAIGQAILAAALFGMSAPFSKLLLSEIPPLRFYNFLGVAFNFTTNLSFLVGFITGIPLSKLTMDSLMNAATKDIDFAMSLDLSINSVLSTFIILLVVFLLSRFLVRAKIAKVMPVEILRQQVD